MNPTQTTKVTGYLRKRLAILYEEAANIEALIEELESIPPAIKEEKEIFIDWETEVAKAIKQNGGACTKAAITKALGDKFKIGHQLVKNNVSLTLLFNEQKRFVKLKEAGHYQYLLSSQKNASVS